MTIEQATESQRLLAQAINALATAANNTLTMEISTGGALATASVPTSVQAIQVYGLNAVGDGGAGIYTRSTGAAAPGTITSADGAVWAPAGFAPGPFANLPPAANVPGMIRAVNNSSVNTWGSVADGAGALSVLVWSNGVSWTVIGK